MNVKYFHKFHSIELVTPALPLSPLDLFKRVIVTLQHHGAQVVLPKVALRKV